MKVGYVVLYVNDAEACRRFWIEQIGPPVGLGSNANYAAKEPVLGS